MSKDTSPKTIKFGIKFKDGYKVEVDAETGHQLWPVAVYHGEDKSDCSYPIWDGETHSHLFGQLMTLVEAITEDKERRKAIKDLISKELNQFERYLKARALHGED